ncbi:hypothetical protein GCM10022409_23660 [Hymenobacter glaciei]|uniref:DUF6311 domain-containing protein n=2 Tax=Hymenobacter glaciei TaxID=877209 RepID=A0ABP7U8H7_9BACT
MGGVLAAAAAWVSLLFTNVLRQPSAYFFSGAGDGLKNYFVAAYFMKYDHGQHFTGMNYPLGEHYTYPDLQPLVSGLATLARPLGIVTTGNAIALLNLLVLASMVVAPVVLYAILRRTHLPVVFAAVAALLIGFMAPQNNRLDGHMTLSYGCGIPLLWYCLVRVQQAPGRTRWYVAYATCSFLLGLVSAYYLAMSSFFLLAHVLVLAAQEGPRAAQRPSRLWPWLGWLVFTALVPLVLFQGWMALVDPVTDRARNPFGFGLFVASFSSVFVPVVEPFKSFWQQLLHTSEPHGEGFSYISMVADLALLLTLVLMLRYAFRRRWRRIFRLVAPAHLRVGLWAAGFLLVLSMGYPFAIPGLGWLADVLPAVKQFRSLGRFAWPFYYVAGVYAAWYFYRLARYLRQHWLHGGVWRVALLAPLLVLWTAEAYVHSHEKADRIGLQPETTDMIQDTDNYTNFLSWANRNPSDFQAIMPLPYFAIGTDKIDIQGNPNAMYQCYKASLNTGLPLLAVHMARSSVGQTLALTQLLSSPLVARPVVAKFPNTKPILLLVVPGVGLTTAEQRLVTLAHRIASRPEADLYELPIAALAANELAAERARAQALLPTLRRQADGLFVTTPKTVLLQSFDQGNDRRGRLAPGAFHEPLDQFSTLYDGPLPTPGDTGRYEVSVWVNAQTAYGLGNMQVKQFGRDAQTNQQGIGSNSSTEIDGDWVRVVLPIRVKPGTNRLMVLYENRDLLVDDLLIRPVDTDAYYYVGTEDRPRLVKNTYALDPAAGSPTSEAGKWSVRAGRRPAAGTPRPQAGKNTPADANGNW